MIGGFASAGRTIGLLALLVLPAAPFAADDSVPPEAPPATALLAPTGYLIGSFTVAHGDYPMGAKNFRYNNYDLKYRQLDPERKPATGMWNAMNEALGDIPDTTRPDEVHGVIGSRGTFLFNKHPHDFRWEEGTGVVFAIALPAGKYEFYQYYLAQLRGNINAKWEAAEDFSIPFDITSGRATYIGEVRAVNLYGRSMLGIRLAAGVRWEVHDSFAHDEPILKKKYPALEGFPVDIRLLGGEATETPAN